eukprot:TRINITY_DN791_c0_g1_i1.p2 TRINITY_DN791_c0_g1~~TRINITY_DN791_c0_g1_i1.p2  ORF type:complete len:142 (-),score=28.14 TRINITY_DN791_c0_g1_i1:293-718(-)
MMTIFVTFLPIFSSLVMAQFTFAPSNYNSGIAGEPKGRLDVNNDGRIDFCRVVEENSQKFIACDVGESDSLSYQSVKGIDLGYSSRKRGFVDANGDGFGDYCRCVGNSPTIFVSCNLGRETGFDKNQYTFIPNFNPVLMCA